MNKEQIECPTCNGVGNLMAPTLGRNLYCPHCNGGRFVDSRYYQWMEIGTRMKQMRQNRRMTQREEANDRGMLVRDLSHMELGWIEPVDRQTPTGEENE
jgi:DnaJ-class molecular chaperone